MHYCVLIRRSITDFGRRRRGGLDGADGGGGGGVGARWRRPAVAVVVPLTGQERQSASQRRR